MAENREPFRFAIMGAGNIANKFCDAVRRLENCCVAAIASKSMERANAFARKNGVEKAYDSYEQMLIETKPDCVYIAVTSDAHYELSMLCLKHNVAVLCEKAMFLNSAQAREVFALAREKNVFVMEAMWSRFLPAIRKAKAWVEAGKIGDPVNGKVAIGFRAPENPKNRYFNPALGGGAAYDLTVYCYEIMTYLIDWPVEVANATAAFGETGVDVIDHVLLRFVDEKNRAEEAPVSEMEAVSEAAGESVLPKRREMFAVCESTFLANLVGSLDIYGSKGRLEIPNVHFASEAFLYDEKGNCTECYKDEVTENGFVYEAQEVINCVRAKKVESDTVPHSLTIACAEMFDMLNASAGDKNK